MHRGSHYQKSFKKYFVNYLGMTDENADRITCIQDITRRLEHLISGCDLCQLTLKAEFYFCNYYFLVSVEMPQKRNPDTVKRKRVEKKRRKQRQFHPTPQGPNAPTPQEMFTPTEIRNLRRRRLLFDETASVNVYPSCSDK